MFQSDTINIYVYIYIYIYMYVFTTLRVKLLNQRNKNNFDRIKKKKIELSVCNNINNSPAKRWWPWCPWKTVQNFSCQCLLIERERKKKLISRFRLISFFAFSFFKLKLKLISKSKASRFELINDFSNLRKCHSNRNRVFETLFPLGFC